ncbi:MAG TPA: response regulator FixJ [Methylomirabilota bacterium]|nr:response regulator FixJ [Methylomirabilota bacterium]
MSIPKPPNEKAVYVVDDDEAVRDSLTMLLESAGFSVEAFASALDALSRCREREPACVLTDVRMPGMDGLQFQHKLAEGGIDVPVIVMTGHGDVPLAVRAMKAGAADFIEKPFADDTILSSLQTAIAAGRQAVDPELTANLESLTPREREVLDLLVAGHPNKVIAYRLDISPRTVEIHRARVMDKMRARSLPELVRMAIQAGIEPAP